MGPQIATGNRCWQPRLHLHPRFCVTTYIAMEIEFDPVKREATLRERGLDFLDVPNVLAGRTYSQVDDRQDYGEERWITYGTLDGRPVVIVHADRDGVLRVISMRHAHRKEIERVRLD